MPNEAKMRCVHQCLTSFRSALLVVPLREDTGGSRVRWAGLRTQQAVRLFYMAT